MLHKQVDPETFAWCKQENARFETEYLAFMVGYQRPPHIQAILDRAYAKIWADVKPFLRDEWTLLGLAENATKRDVKNAYRRMARKLHPDKGGDPEAFKAIYAAYRKLLTVAKE